MSYPAERKEVVLKKMLPPNNKTIKELAREEGISEGTLHNWRKAARSEGRLMPNGRQYSARMGVSRQVFSSSGDCSDERGRTFRLLSRTRALP